jgi:hypothetical protein
MRTLKGSDTSVSPFLGPLGSVSLAARRLGETELGAEGDHLPLLSKEAGEEGCGEEGQTDRQTEPPVGHLWLSGCLG